MRHEAEITGTEGQLRCSGHQLWRSRSGIWEEIAAPEPDVPERADGRPSSPAFLLELREFARAIAEDREPSVSGAYGREIVRVLLACEESSATGREVRLDPSPPA
jgi:predicted dehydrogenase